MPYEIRYRPGLKPKERPWKIWNKEKRMYVGSSLTKERAESAVKARLMGEHGIFTKLKKQGKLRKKQ